MDKWLNLVSLKAQDALFKSHYLKQCDLGEIYKIQMSSTESKNELLSPRD